MAEREKKQSTKLVDGGRRREWRGRLVNPPIERASTILFDSISELHGSRPGLGKYRYGLQGTATQWALSDALTQLEPGAAGTALYSSGLAAIMTALFTVLSPGDELLATTPFTDRRGNFAKRSSSASGFRHVIMIRASAPPLPRPSAKKLAQSCLKAPVL